MTIDRTTYIAWSVALILHSGLAAGLGKWSLGQMRPAEVPLLIEVTLAGTSAPKSMQEGVKGTGPIGAKPSEEESTGLTPAQVKAWKLAKKREIMRELAKTRGRMKIGASSKELRQKQNKLAGGRGAGDWGIPGSPTGTLSLTGTIASRGYKEPDFSVLKKMITEETSLKVTVIVLPGGEVKKVLLHATSGFPYVDQKALELARKIVFDPLPADWKQIEQQGVLTIKLKL